MKSALHGLIRVLETTKERNINRNFPNQNSKRKKNGKKKNRKEYSRAVGEIQKV